jgi:PHD/YefM family antitoxin component YafN of YafNO toxin-antitoxin module
MFPIIKASSELRTNYNSIAELCRVNRSPVFLTKNGKGDTVIMDMETYSRREEDLEVARRLIDAERARLAGIDDISLESFEGLMKDAIAEGAHNVG